MNAGVVCPEPLTADTARDVLAAGGNAVDALVAAVFTQGLTAPFMTGIGGSAKFHLFDGASRRSVTLNAAAMVGSRPVPDHWASEYLGRSETIGAHRLRSRANSVGSWSVMVPGVVRGCWVAFRRYGSGRLSWSEVLEPSIRLARDGVRVDALLARSWQRQEPGGVDASDRGLTSPVYDELRSPDAVHTYLKSDGSGYTEGDVLRNANASRTLRRLAEAGGDDFYDGEIAAQIVADLDAQGSTVTARDLRDYRVIELPPVEGRYRDLRISSMPAPSAGPQVIEMLQVLEDLDIRRLGHNSVEYIDAVARIQRAGFVDYVRYHGVDQRESHRIAAESITRARAAEWAKRIRNGDRIVVHDGTVAEAGTTHITVADREGGVAGCTNSIGGTAGAGFMTPGLGFLYNNFLAHFSPIPGQANSIAPGKRLGGGPPTLLLRGDRPVMGIGAPGGTRINTSIFQTIVNVFDHQMDMLAAVSAPRFHSEHEQVVFLEPELADSVGPGLEALGNEVRRSTNMSRVQAIRVRDDGSLDLAADPRGGVTRVLT